MEQRGECLVSSRYQPCGVAPVWDEAEELQSQKNVLGTRLKSLAECLARSSRCMPEWNPSLTSIDLWGTGLARGGGEAKGVMGVLREPWNGQQHLASWGTRWLWLKTSGGMD